MKISKKKSNTTTAKLKKAAKLATAEAKRENNALGLSVLITRKDGLYLTSPDGKARLVKKGNYERVRVPFQTIKIAK